MAARASTVPVAKAIQLPVASFQLVVISFAIASVTGDPVSALFYWQLATLLFSSDYLLPLLSKPGDAEPNDAAGAQIHRRLHAVADSRRRAGRDDVAGVQAHELAQVAYEVRHA